MGPPSRMRVWLPRIGRAAGSAGWVPPTPNAKSEAQPVVDARPTANRSAVELGQHLVDVARDEDGVEQREVVHALGHERGFGEVVAEDVVIEVACEQGLGRGGLLVREYATLGTCFRAFRYQSASGSPGSSNGRWRSM